MQHECYNTAGICTFAQVLIFTDQWFIRSCFHLELQRIQMEVIEQNNPAKKTLTNKLLNNEK